MHVSLLKMVRNCSTGHIGSINMNALGPDKKTDRYTYVHTTYKSNFKKPVTHQLMTGMCLVKKLNKMIFSRVIYMCIATGNSDKTLLHI